jgi:hypothetical protein
MFQENLEEIITFRKTNFKNINEKNKESIE